jgi:hypothetical protein
MNWHKTDRMIVNEVRSTNVKFLKKLNIANVECVPRCVFHDYVGPCFCLAMSVVDCRCVMLKLMSRQEA